MLHARTVLQGTLVLILGLGLAGCQDYAYEELPQVIITKGGDIIKRPLAQKVDILFVIDNSGSMVGEQVALARSFSSLTSRLDERFGAGMYRIAVITPGVASPGCPACDGLITSSCINETGEGGRFQDRLGRVLDDTTDPPVFDFSTDPTCRTVDSTDLRCFVDPAGGGLYGRGTVFVGVQGCGYERGLEGMRLALSDLAAAGDADFLRDDATLAVIVISDEEDCGAVGDVSEGVAGLGGKICYHAARGAGPDGARVDPLGKPYALTPVEDYRDFLEGLKGGRAGMVKFVAVVGVEDPEHPLATEIRFDSDLPGAAILPACQTPGCAGAGDSCLAFPGTRYLALADLFGIDEDSFVGTICQEDYSALMERVAELISCPDRFNLLEMPLDPALMNVLINGEPVPRHTCSDPADPVRCAGPGATCAVGACTPTWTWTPPGDPPDPLAPGGVIAFAAHYKPCDLQRASGATEIVFEVTYVLE